jgi:ribosomal-protein-alanine N-acetyltransferase
MRLETERLIIRPYQEEDLMDCFQLMQDKELFQYQDMEVMSLDTLFWFLRYISSVETCFHTGA